MEWDSPFAFQIFKVSKLFCLHRRWDFKEPLKTILVLNVWHNETDVIPSDLQNWERKQKAPGRWEGPGFFQGNFLRVIRWWVFYETGRMGWCVSYTMEPSVLSSAFGFEAHLCLQMLPALFPFHKLWSLQLMERRPQCSERLFSECGRELPYIRLHGWAEGSSFCKN